MGLQLVDAVLLTWGFWHPQYGGSLSALLPAPRYSNASVLPSLQNGARQQEACKGFISLFLFHLLFRQWSWLSALCRIQPISCSSSAGCCSRRSHTSLQGEHLGSSVTMLHQSCPWAAQYWWQWLGSLVWSGLLMALDCHNRSRLFWPGACWMSARKCCNRREFGSACVFSYRWAHKEIFWRQSFPSNVKFHLCSVLNERKK